MPLLVGAPAVPRVVALGTSSSALELAVEAGVGTIRVLEWEVVGTILNPSSAVFQHQQRVRMTLPPPPPLFRIETTPNSVTQPRYEVWDGAVRLVEWGGVALQGSALAGFRRCALCRWVWSHRSRALIPKYLPDFQKRFW